METYSVKYLARRSAAWQAFVRMRRNPRSRGVSASVVTDSDPVVHFRPLWLNHNLRAHFRLWEDATARRISLNIAKGPLIIVEPSGRFVD
ncbi:MAG: hypothetical protein MUO70_01885 [Euryarchaeota archaeon]|nr:hypothetical protein [Euryarchaeota archaeon]